MGGYFDLAESWMLSLRADRKSRQTIRVYQGALDSYVGWSTARDLQPSLDPAAVREWIADCLDDGQAAMTVSVRTRALKLFSRWLAAEGETPADLLAPVRAPSGDETIVPGITDDELSALVKACRGGAFRDHRDLAIVRLMAETGIRAEELLKLQLADVHLIEGWATIHGKGRRERIVPFSATTAKAIDVYLRKGRRGHRLAHTPDLWLGDRGHPFRSYKSLYQTLAYRARLAGIEGFHPHRLRHTNAVRWLARGGSEVGLKAVMGWSSSRMIDRYTRYDQAMRAVDESRGLALDDF